MRDQSRLLAPASAPAPSSARLVGRTSATAQLDAAELAARLLAIPHRPKLHALSPPPSPPETWTQPEEDGPNSIAFVDLTPQILSPGSGSGDATFSPDPEDKGQAKEESGSGSHLVMLLPGTESSPCIIVEERSETS